MPVAKLPVGYASHRWVAFKDGKKPFYADTSMVLGADGEPLTDADFYVCHLLLQTHGLRNPTDREFNVMVHQNPEIAGQMRDYAVWSSFLRNVERVGGRYSANYIARPEIVKTSNGYAVKGSERAITLPSSGWFTVKELLESENGLPEKTYNEGNVPDEPCAYFWIAEGSKSPMVRGAWDRHGCRQFDADASWAPSDSSYCVGILAVSDTKPNLQPNAKRIMAAGAYTLQGLDALK